MTESLLANIGIPAIVLILLLREIVPLLKNKNGSKCKAPDSDIHYKVYEKVTEQVAVSKQIVRSIDRLADKIERTHAQEEGR